MPIPIEVYSTIISYLRDTDCWEISKAPKCSSLATSATLARRTIVSRCMAGVEVEDQVGFAHYIQRMQTRHTIGDEDRRRSFAFELTVYNPSLEAKCFLDFYRIYRLPTIVENGYNAVLHALQTALRKDSLAISELLIQRLTDLSAYHPRCILGCNVGEHIKSASLCCFMQAVGTHPIDKKHEVYIELIPAACLLGKKIIAIFYNHNGQNFLVEIASRYSSKHRPEGKVALYRALDDLHLISLNNPHSEVRSMMTDLWQASAEFRRSL